MARRSRRRGGALVAVLLLLAVGAVAVVWAPTWWERYSPDIIVTERCTVTLGDRTDTKTAEQANNAALITAVSMRRGLPARAATIAIATAIQESSLRNIDYGDRDSIGLFQQRPSQGWGTVEEIMDPYYATNAFYDGLIKVEGWEYAEITDAAQEVQRSAFPLAYADHEEEGRLWASALTGYGGTITCTLDQSQPTTAADFLERLDADFGEGYFPVAVADAGATSVTLSTTTSTAVSASAFANWSVATAWDTEADAVADYSFTWMRDEAVPGDVESDRNAYVLLPTAPES